MAMKDYIALAERQTGHKIGVFDPMEVVNSGQLSGPVM
jgi:hypothetical protein